MESAPWTSDCSSFSMPRVTASRWPSSARATASAGASATSGSPGSRRRASGAWRIAAARRTRARTRSGPCSRSCSASSAGRIPTGARGSCSRCCAGGIRRSRTGPRRVRPPICSRGVGSCASAGAGIRISIPAWCRSATAAPNDLWTADFKGQFRTGNGVYCYPLTIADQHTRFLLTCHGLLSTETAHRASRSSSAPSGSTGCRARSAPTTACPSPRRRFTGCRI